MACPAVVLPYYYPGYVGSLVSIRENPNCQPTLTLLSVASVDTDYQ